MNAPTDLFAELEAAVQGASTREGEELSSAESRAPKNATLQAELDIPLHPAPQRPLTEYEWERVLGGRGFTPVVTPEQEAWTAGRSVRCMRCARAGDSNHAEPWRAWCLAHRCMVSNTFPVLCRKYVQR